VVWVAYLGVGAGLVAAAAGLETGVLQAMLHVGSMSAADLTHSWPRQVEDTTVATVLGVLSLLLVIPAAFFYILIMFAREAALIILVATAPISAAGLVNDTTKVWFWKSLRWFIAALLIAPTAALVLGVGVRLSAGVVAGTGDRTAAAAGMAVVGTIMVAVGACCPLVLFRLLAFVEPGTASGAALRQSWSDAGGLPGMLSGRTGGQTGGGGSVAAHSGSDGRSGGESSAESQTSSRLAGMLGPVGGAIGTAASMAHRAVDLGSDVLGQAGVGSPGYSMTPTDERSSRPAGRVDTVASTSPDGGSGSGGNPGSTPPPTPPPAGSGGPPVAGPPLPGPPAAPGPGPQAPAGPQVPGGQGRGAGGGGPAAGGAEPAAAAGAL